MLEPDLVNPVEIDDLIYLPGTKTSGGWLDAYQHYDALAIRPSIPFTGIGYIALEDGFTDKVMRTFNLMRLHYIRQLAFLSRPVLRDTRANEVTATAIYFHHSRYLHVLDVQAVLVPMLKNSNLSESEFYTLRAAALLHDTLTPAGGDTTKHIDFEAFDEDLHFPELLDTTEWQDLQAEYNVDESLLVDTVQGKGYLSTLLDIADKIAYTCGDYHQLYGEGRWPFKLAPEHKQLASLVQGNPRIGSLWHSVRVQDQKVIFTNEKLLFDFLKMRALMFRNLYSNPNTKFTECFLGKIILPYLYRQKHLSRDTLLSMTDHELMAIINRFLGERGGIELIGDRTVHVESFETKAQALQREHALQNQGIELSFIEEMQLRTKSGIHYLVEVGEKYAAYSDAFPEDAGEIASYMQHEKPVRLFWVEGTKFSQNILDALEEYKKV